MEFDEDEQAEADMLADEVHGKPLVRTPEEGIKDMERRIVSLNKRLAAAQAKPAAVGHEDIEINLIRQIREATARLAEYEIQLKGRN